MSDIASATGLTHYHQSQNYTDKHSPEEHVQDVNDSINNENGTCQNTNGNTEQEEESPSINVVISNVVCSFAVRCHINLRKLATEAANVEYKVANGMVSMKLRKPYTTASIWSSGKITCTGATSEDESKVAARRISRILQRMGYRVKMANYRVVNVLGSCSLPFGINIRNFSEAYPRDASYEPELHPGATFRIKSPKATLKVFSTGSLTITAPSVDSVQQAVALIFPLVYPYKTPKPVKKVSETKMLLDKHYGSKRHKRQQRPPTRRYQEGDSDDEDEGEEADLSDEFDYGSYSEDEEDLASDQSFD